MCKKLWIISIVLFLTSCTVKQYDIEWNVFSNIDVDSIELSLMFSNSPRGQQQKRFRLIPNNTKKIKVSNEFKFGSYEQTMNVHVVYNPDVYMLPDGGIIEVYLFNPNVIKNSEVQYTITSDDNAFAYFVDFFLDGKYYYVVSKDNVLNIDMSNIQNTKSISDILEESSQYDVTYFNQSRTAKGNNRYPDYWGGYIVKSKNYGNLIWLDPAN